MKNNFFSNGFLVLLGLVVAANLLVYNDWFSVFPGAEVQILAAAGAPGPAWFSLFVQSILEAAGNSSIFLIRFPSVVLLLGSLYGIYYFGKTLFGEQRILNTLIVLAASPLLIGLGKLASGDVALFGGLALGFITALHYLKTNKSTWRTLHLAFLVLALWVHPWSALAGIVAFDLLAFFLHPQGKRVMGLWHWALFPIVLGGLYFLNAFPFPAGDLYLSFAGTSAKTFWVAHLVGMLPWWGFLAAGLWQLWINGRKGEEWSLILIALLVGGIASWSLVLQFVFALLVARSLQDYQRANYPYQSLVRGLALVGLLVVFCMGAVGMVNGFYYLQGTGFRIVMTACIGFWIPYLVSIIGLFGLKINQYRNMAALAGAFSFFFLLVQGGPVLETLRSWQQHVPEQVAVFGFEEMEIMGYQSNAVLSYYADQNSIEINSLLPNQTNETGEAPVLIDSADFRLEEWTNWQVDTFPAWQTWWYLLVPSETLAPEQEEKDN